MSNVSVIGYTVEEIQPEVITLETKQAVAQRVVLAELNMPRFASEERNILLDRRMGVNHGYEK